MFKTSSTNPCLRFNGFSDEWSEKNILDISSMKARIGWQNLRQDEHMDNGEYFLITGTDFKNNRIEWNTTKFVSYERYAQDMNIILQDEDILITKDGSVGKLAFVGELNGRKATLNNGIFRIRITSNEFPQFIFYTFLSRRFKYFFYTISGGSSIVHLYQKDFEKYKLLLPKKQEQQKIASFLCYIDDWIENLTQQKLALEKYKKGLMQKIFSQQIRFKDNNGMDFPKWEILLLSQIFERKNVRNSDNKIKIVLTNSAIHGIVNQREFFEKDIANQDNLTNYYIVDVNDFVYNPRISDNAPYGPFHRNKLTQGIMSPLYIVLKPKQINLDFFEKYFESSFWHKHMFKIANYGARHDRLSFSQDDFMNMPIPFPHLEEQKKIAKMLSSLDSLILSKNSQIEKVQLWKKGLIQKLFI